jgi:hypothetical protein
MKRENDDTLMTLCPLAGVRCSNGYRPAETWRQCRDEPIVMRLARGLARRRFRQAAIAITRSCRLMSCRIATITRQPVRMPFEPSPEERQALSAELARLREEHADLDMAIDALDKVGSINQLQVQRMKKRKLYLKDRIIAITDRLTPDIIA